MGSFLWQLVLRAGRETVADWGTSLLGWILIFIIPIGVLAMKGGRAEKGKRWIEIREKWQEELRDVFAVTIVVSMLIFSYELFWGLPSKIWMEAAEIQPPPSLFRAPPAPPPPTALLDDKPPIRSGNGTAFSKIPSNDQARIKVINTEAALVDSHGKGNPAWSLINVTYNNLGNLPADQVAFHAAISIDLNSQESEADIRKVQDNLLTQKDWNERMIAKRGQEMEKTDGSRFFSIPDSKTGIEAKWLAGYFGVADPVKRIYVFVTFKYRDRSMPAHVRGVSEYCGLIIGNGNISAIHPCGRIRNFLEQY
jgi:hypothetical protein